MTAGEVLTDWDVLSRLQLFRGVSHEDIEVYLQRFRIKRLSVGDVLLSPEKKNTHIYLLLKGRMLVHLKSLDTPALTSLDPGECIGELSIIDMKNPSAYVVASEVSELLEIDQDILWDIVNNSHGIAKNMLYVLSRRVRYDNDLLAHSMQLQRLYKHYATVDALTGLHNRRWLDDMFEREMYRSKYDRQSLHLIMIDIDNFKQVNDTYGHLIGDQVLCEVATNLRKLLRPNDMVARYGGEEFTVLLPDTRMGDTLMIAERLRNGVEKATLAGGKGGDLPAITISLGVVSMGDDDDTLEKLFHKADKAMYKAKQSGKNKVCRYDGEC
jgi:diguanylate cyclase (GGDEF)-like protein